MADGRRILRSMVGGALALGAGVGLAALVPSAPVSLAGSTWSGGASTTVCSGTPQVLTVGLPGTVVNGVAPAYNTIQAAVDAAHPCDWVLVAPGDYKEPGAAAPAGRPDLPSGVLVTTSGIHIRGLDRNGVVVDGTHSGPACSAAPADQDFGPAGAGRNGIMVWKADDVSVENLTACNFLHGTGSTGNEIWWNGGDSSAQVGGWGYYGGFLTATSTYYHDESTAAQYGIFSSNWSGGTWDQTYASNFNDSGYYIGACQQVCDQNVDHAWAEYNALGYSGSNSGGVLVVQNSQFDNNEDGFDTNSQNGDNPPPQDGACPPGTSPPVDQISPPLAAGDPPVTTCWIFAHNWVHNNNDANVPAAGSAAAGPVGTGISLSGARDDTVIENTFENNGAWGAILVPYPDNGPPCTGGTQLQVVCLYDENGDAVLANTFGHNGFFGNPTNGDIGATNVEPGPTDCFHGNVEEGAGSLTTSPPDIEQLYPACTGATVPPDLNAPFTAEVACDAQAISIGPVPAGDLCLPGNTYPRSGGTVVMHPLPSLATMTNPCAGVPATPWCPYGPVAQPSAAVTIVGDGHPAVAASGSVAPPSFGPVALSRYGLRATAGSDVYRRRP